MVRNVGGERIEVTTLVGPNGDAHVYSPTPADGRRLTEAGIVFANGLKFEGWIDRLVKSSGTKAANDRGRERRQAAGRAKTAATTTAMAARSPCLAERRAMPRSTSPISATR